MPSLHTTPFGAALRRHRLAAGLTQEELAEHAGLSPRGLVALENGERARPHQETVRLLAEALRLEGTERARFAAAARGRGYAAAQAVPPSQANPAVPHHAPDARPTDAAAVPLVGRARELELLEWHLAGQGPPVLVLAGEPGIGKTRLLRQAEHTATGQGATVLRGGCYRRSGQEPYAPVPHMLAEYLQALSPSGLREALRDCTWLVRVLPELTALLGEPAPSGALPPGQERRLVFGAVGRLLANLAGPGGVALVLDDLQWAPGDALDLLSALLHEPALRTLRVVGAYRSTDVRPQDPLAVMLADLAHAGLAHHHTVEPLEEHEARQLLAHLVEEPQRASPAAQEALRHAGGVPFYLVSYAHALRLQRPRPAPADDVPWDVAHAIRQRVAALPALAQELLGVAAVVGRVVPHPLLSAILGRPGTEVLGALDTARQARLLVETGDSESAHQFTHEFTHDVIREVIEADLGAARRRLLHRTIAETLEARAGEPSVEDLAYHLGHSDQPERALPYLAKAAERARLAAAHRQEAAVLAQALVLAQRGGRDDLVGDLHARRGKALFALTRWAEARQEMEAALERVAPGQEERRAEILADLALASHWLIDAAATRRYASEALALADGRGRDDLAVGALSALVLADSSDGELGAGLKRYRQAAARAAGRYPAPLAPGAEMAALILYWRADFEEAIRRAREAVQLGRAAHDASTVARALGNLGCALTGSGRYAEALQVFTEVQQLSRAQGAINWLARSTAMRGGLHLDLCDVGGAATLAAEARELSRSAGWVHAEVSGGIDLLLAFTRGGEIGRAEGLRDEVAAGVARGQGAHGWLWRLRFTQAQAELALARGDYEAALRWAAEGIAQSRARGRVKYEVAGLQVQASALAAQGRQREAIVTLQVAVERARGTGDPAIFVRVAAALLGLDGSDALMADARTAVERIVRALPDAELSRHFQDAEPVRAIVRPMTAGAAHGERNTDGAH